MTFKSWQDINPGIIGAGLSLVLYAVTFIWPLIAQKLKCVTIPARWQFFALRAFWSLFVISIGVFVLFEVYFQAFNCSVSSSYYNKNMQLANEVTSILRREKIDFWLDYATLLGYLRNDPINVWDHDTDFSILRKDEGVIPRLLQLFNTPGPYGMHAEYEGVRSLIQVRYNKGHQGPHVDLWMWHPDPKTSLTSIPMMRTFDPDVNTQTRPFSQIFPVQFVNWAGMNVSVPFDAHGVAQHEFARYGGTYMKQMVFRGDCLHNIVSLRWLPFAWMSFTEALILFLIPLTFIGYQLYRRRTKKPSLSIPA